MRWILIILSCCTLLLSNDAVFADDDSNANQMANVQAIMARAHQLQSQQQTQTAQAEQQSASQQQATSPGFFHSLLKDMTDSPKQEMSSQDQQPTAYYSSSPAPAAPAAALPLPVATVDTNGLFQQATNQRLDALEQAEANTQAKVAQFAEAISMINEQEVQLNQQVQAINKQLNPMLGTGGEKASKVNPLLSTLEGETHTKTTEYVSYVILLLLVIIILLMLMPRRSAYRLETVESNAEIAITEYDAMATEEGLSTKLDLARAYVAMEDYQAARRILAEVKQSGNKQQRDDAEKMDRMMPNNK